MAPYGIPTNQFEEYRSSVHWEALAKRGDLSAPSCASCHGNHGAKPPQVESVSAVCGTCHVAWLRSLAAAARWRAGGANSDQVLNGQLVAPAAVPLYPASTTFATLDPNGNAVVCAVTMNNLFGTGRMVPGVGFLAAASPAAVTPPLLASGLAWRESNHAFHAEAGGSGQAGAALAAAVALSNSLRSGQPMQSLAPEPGRANVITCGRYLPGSESHCAAAADPRESGMTAGGGS